MLNYIMRSLRNLLNEDGMNKETNKQKPNTKEKEKRQAIKEKAEGKPVQMMPS